MRSGIYFIYLVYLNVFLIWGPHVALPRDYSWFCAQGFPLAVLVLVIKPGWAACQASGISLYYFSACITSLPVLSQQLTPLHYISRVTQLKVADSHCLSLHRPSHAQVLLSGTHRNLRIPTLGSPRQLSYLMPGLGLGPWTSSL